MSAVRALVVDDSPSMRAIISHALTRDGGIEVVGTADCPARARELMKTLDPDVVTLDIEMPGMNGLDFLEKIMRLRPTPVVMISTLTQRHADASIRALELGAFDSIGKPVNGAAVTGEYSAEVAAKVKAAARSRHRIRTRLPGAATAAGAAPSYRPREGTMLAVGSSTGGVEALIELLAGFPETCPPTVIVQHMPEAYTGTFAARLDRLSRPRVELARHGGPVLPGHVYLAPGGERHLEIAGDGPWRCRLVPDGKVNGHRPSVDRLFHSVARAAGGRAAAAILTGMGNDGARGMRAMRDAGAFTIGQNEESCVVYGMPMAARKADAVAIELPLSRIAGRLLSELRA